MSKNKQNKKMKKVFTGIIEEKAKEMRVEMFSLVNKAPFRTRFVFAIKALFKKL